MDDIKPQNKPFNHIEVLNNISSIRAKLWNMIKHKNKDQCTNIDLVINALSYQMSYFWRIVNFFYPLGDTYQNIKTNPDDYNNDKIINNEIEIMDFTSKKAFLVLTAFSFEEILDVIIEKHNISIEKHEPIIEKFQIVIDYFEIEREEYIDLVKIFYYTRNTLHSGTFVTQDSGPLKYKGERFDMKKGQKYIKHTSWNHFTYFASQIIDIFVKIYKSKKFKYA